MKLSIATIAATMLAVSFAAASAGAAEVVTAKDVFDNCRNRSNAGDINGHLDFSFKNASGETTKGRKALYFWKDYAGSDDLWSKTIMVVLDPPEYEDVGYLRYEYTLASGRKPDQWIYVPKQQRVRRLTLRDATDETWGLVGDDLQVLQWGDGDMRLLSAREDEHGTTYRIEIIPKSKELPYVKVISTYLREGDGWERCNRQRTEFLDKVDKLIKALSEEWSQQGQFWYRHRVNIDNMVTRVTAVGEITELDSSVEYLFRELRFNTGLTDKDFTTRLLQQPDHLIRKMQ